VAALIGGGAAAAPDPFGRVPGQIRIGPSKLDRYRVRLAIPQAGWGREVEPVIGLPVYVCEVLTVLRGRDCSYQRPVGIDVPIDYVARIVGVPCPAEDCVAARPVMGPLKVRRSAASDVLGTAGQRDARAGNLDADRVHCAVQQGRGRREAETMIRTAQNVEQILTGHAGWSCGYQVDAVINVYADCGGWVVRVPGPPRDRAAAGSIVKPLIIRRHVLSDGKRLPGYCNRPGSCCSRVYAH